MFLRFLTILFLIPSIGPLSAGEMQSLDQILRDLSHDGVVMNLAAHPDDEDGATLAYYRLKYGARTHSVLFTRGEGGQNEIGPELYEELGVIRTAETIRAGEIIGARVDFLNLFDFGFSKSATEAFEKWGGKEEVLRRLVYVIRKYQPDILFTNHSTGGGHGHHQAVAITAIEAFDAASDPARFPEQLLLPGLNTWQPKKLYLRILPWNGGRPDVTHLIGGLHSDRSYIDIANDALREHRSQGLGSADIARFTQGKSEYRLARTYSSYADDSTSFFGGITLLTTPEDSMLLRFRDRINDLAGERDSEKFLAMTIDMANQIGRIDRAALAPLQRRIVDDWQHSLEQLVRHLSSVEVSLLPDDTLVIPGQAVAVSASVSARGHTTEVIRLTVAPATGWSVGTVDRKGPESWTAALTASANAAQTYPAVKGQYRSIESESSSLFLLETIIDGKSVQLTEQLSLDLTTPYGISVTPSTAWVRPSDAGRRARFAYTLINHHPHKVAGSLEITPPPGWRADEVEFMVASEDGSAEGVFDIVPAEEGTTGSMPVRVSAGGADALATIRSFDVAVSSGLHVGIIKSYDNTLETVSAELQVPFSMIDAEMLEKGDLSRFSTIVVDIRAYSVREDLRSFNHRLLKFVGEGGNLVVFYHKPQDWKPEYAPYPFTLSRDRVTVEEAPIRVLNPSHDLLNLPNKIVPQDWDGWVQERGVYFPEMAAPEYMTIVSSHDPDEPPLETGLLVARHGKGTYIYSSYVWYRQMKELHEGAIKCYANFISYRQ